MRFTNCLRAAVCCLVLGSAGMATAAPLTDVVYGNLGASGTNAVSNTSTDVGLSLVPGGATSLVGTQFSASGPNLNVTSVGLWLFGDGSIPATVGIYSNVAGLPGTLQYQSSTVNVGAKSLYTFNFSGANLTSGSTYWIVPQTANEISWYITGFSGASSPVGQNSSGYSFAEPGTASFNGTSWRSEEPIFYSVTVQAVPEPSAYALAALGLGVAGIVRARRRKSAV